MILLGHWAQHQKNMSIFYAFTGCDTVSAFVGKDQTQHCRLGKAWNVFENVKEVFKFVSSTCDILINELEEFVCSHHV